ncbi:MAG: hypothetical protein CR985_00145 [Flavobacteriales bacterium]|nr:MAG: hypothetical protein CR985_00145 [Flavobacteriales bacterium]
MLFYPTYFSPIIQYAAIAKAKDITFEICDNYQKQTYRTRCYIYSPNGLQLLNVPIKHMSGRQKTADVKIDYTFNWQALHKKSLDAAYRSSPYYEFYEDEIIGFFEQKHTFLLDLNIKTFELISEIMEWNRKVSKTISYEKVYPNKDDFRFLADAKTKRDFGLSPYPQVFSYRHGFLPNLSVLDVLFNLGPEAEGYLENSGDKIELQ